jgi:hypothetical protein
MSVRVLARESSRAKPSDSRVREVTESANLELRVLNLIRSLLAELGSQRVLRRASLEVVFGLGGLERLELLLRLQKEFQSVSVTL